MKSSVIGFLVSLFFCIISMMIYFVFLKKDNYFLLDNPTNKKIEIILNDKKIALNPFEKLKIDLKKGKNSLQILQQNKVIKDTFFETNLIRGVLNPTFNEYYIFTQYYGVLKNKDSLFLANHTTIDNKIYFGEIKKENSLLITEFYFNLDENYQKAVKNIDTLERRKKIFRKKDFIDFYDKKYR